ncbi:hypothetical protein ACFORL_03300 [Legionella dresdenensis]|uniref:Uncharacterized protein n=1 Tax=Legionella dresdenensis TaxID=450200 RepID=A0ABV8CCS1_9GAMM
MFSFFSPLPMIAKRYMSSVAAEFRLAKASQTGEIIKILLKNEQMTTEHFLTNFKDKIGCRYRNTLFLVTMPTKRINGAFEVFPGHNLLFFTDENGAVDTSDDASISNRPNTAEVIGEYPRVPDQRFKNKENKVKLYAPMFTSVEMEFAGWLKYAKIQSGYPLYLQALPVSSEVASQIKGNIEIIKDYKRSYALFSYVVDKYERRSIPANNCNRAVQEAVLGFYSKAQLQDKSCQEAAIELGGGFAADPREHLAQAASIKLTDGIEASPIPEENYYASATC